jgi:acyl-coenzyme A thioesterase PaaI-like protein
MDDPALMAELEAHLQAPMSRVLGLRLVSVETGNITMSANPQLAFRNKMGVMHGGYIAALLDCACGLAGATVMRQGFSL